MEHKVVGIESSGFDLPDIAANHDAMVETFLKSARKLINENRAELIIPTGISQCPVHMNPKWLMGELGVPVVEGIGAPIRMAAMLVGLGPQWVTAHVRWSIVLVGATGVLLAGLRDPAAR